MSDPLLAFPVLQDLGKAERRRLEGYLEERRHAKGDVVWSEHDESREALLLLEGSVRIEAQERVCGSVGAGEVLGGLSLVAIGPRECSATATEDVRLYALTRESYLRLRTEAPALALLLQECVLRSFAGAVRSLLSGIASSEAPEVPDEAAASS